MYRYIIDISVKSAEIVTMICINQWRIKLVAHTFLQVLLYKLKQNFILFDILVASHIHMMKIIS